MRILHLVLSFLVCLAPCTEAGRGVSPFGTQAVGGPSLAWAGNYFDRSYWTIVPHAGQTFRTIAPVQDPDLPRDTTNPQTLLLGLNLSLTYAWEPVLMPAIGLGIYMEDGAFSVDLIPKAGSLLGAVGVGLGATLRDGEPGIVAEGWAAIFAGLRLRRTWIGRTDRTSLSLFVAVPTRL